VNGERHLTDGLAAGRRWVREQVSYM
jgi:hypothetical protein